MSRQEFGLHEDHARKLRARVAEMGLIDRELRRGALARAAGGPAIAEPYDALARQVAEDSSRVTDTQVRNVQAATGSEMGTFEVILSAAIGAGLGRWDAAERVIEEASRAAD